MSRNRVSSLVQLLVGFTLALGIGCGGSDDNNDTQGNGNEYEQQTTVTCTCDLTINGEHETFSTCGESKCIDGRKYVCTEDGANDSGECTVQEDTTEEDDTSVSFPAVCDNLPMTCPDQTSLDACENGSAGFSACNYLPITSGCASSGCVSEAQICRTAELSAGYCTHSCVDDEDCPISGGGQATCTNLGGPTICIVAAE